MSDNVLKKEFSKSDVNRIRNLVKGDYDSATSNIVGYVSKDIERKEGDVWEENGRTWTIKDGLRQNVTKLNTLSDSFRVPLFCPNCKKPMKNRNDKSFYHVHGKCFDCVVVMEAELKQNGEWENYEKGIINSELDGKIEEFKTMLEAFISEGNTSFVTEAGDVEKWDGGINIDQVEEYRKYGIDYLNSLKK